MQFWVSGSGDSLQSYRALEIVISLPHCNFSFVGIMIWGFALALLT